MSGGGPRTTSGKAITRRNALRHGVLSTLPVVPGLERPGDWQARYAGILASLAPEGHMETVLAERVALQLWRLHRVARYEALSLVTAQEAAERDVLERLRGGPAGDPPPAVQLGSGRAAVGRPARAAASVRPVPPYGR